MGGVGGVGGVFACEYVSLGKLPAWVTCYCGLRGPRARLTCLRDGGPAWVKWVMCQRG